MAVFGRTHSLRKLMALFAMIAFAMVPLSASASGDAACESSTIVCGDYVVSDISSDKVPDHEGHDHSAHHCGSCHVHLLSEVSGGATNSIDVSCLRVPPLHESKASAGPDGLYRPPRV